MKKILSILAVMLLAIVAIPAALAVSFEATAKINGHELDSTTVLDVERGETLDLDLAVEADEDVKDLRWRVWVGGYEDLIEEKTSLFDLKANVTKVKSLSITIPADVDADEQYALHVELINGNVDYEVPLNIEVSKTRHLLTVTDVLVSPSKTVKAGDSVTVNVRVENMGSYREDATVTVGIPALGVSASAFIDDLAELNDEDQGDFDNTASTGKMVLALPANAAAGTYDLTVDVVYHRGRNKTSAKQTLTVAGEATAEPATVEGVITVDATTKTLAQSEEKAYKVAFANLGKTAQLYTVRVVGTQLWADARVEPSLIAVPAGQVAEAVVYLKANDDAELGNHVFAMQVRSGNDLVKEIALGAKVTEKAQTAAPAASLLQYSSTMKLAFVGLVVLLEIVGLFVAFRKLKEDEEYPLEPKDGQTYY